MSNITQVDMNGFMEQSFLDYSISVITERSLPDSRDGLKPVQRRTIYDMFELGTTADKPHRKCARIVGDTMGKYHPHGDSSIYGALVLMGQPWSLRYPLVDGHGNFGSQDGDGPAAMRYTEARLSKIAAEMVKDLKKNVVDFKPNFDETENEPVVLPAAFPNLLVNGTSGIAVGMACSFAPHNLTEVMNAAIALIQNEELSIDDLLQYISGPDFPTGGLIINKDELPIAYKSGKGRARIRGRYNVETSGTKQLLVFYEIPFKVAKEDLIASITSLVESKEIEGITDVRDESDKNGMRLIIEIRKDVNADAIANKLFAKTRLEDTYSFNQVCLVNGSPKLLNLKQLLEAYISHQKEVIRRQTQFDLDKAQARMHILEGLLIALEDIDNVIALIKASKSRAEACINLQTKYKMSEIQAKAVIDMKLGKLTSLEKVEINTEAEELAEKIEDFKEILSNSIRLNEVLISNCQTILSKYGDKRLSEITQISVKPEEKEIEQVIPEDMVVVVSRNGSIKRIPTKSFKVQKKNGKGIKSQEDAVMDIIKTNTIDTLVLFSSEGKMYRLLVDNIPVGTNVSRGTPINTLVNLNNNETIIALTSLYRETNAEFAVFITKQGMVKKTKLEEYLKTKRSTGIAALNLKEGDSIATITFLKDEELVLITKQGLSIRFETASIAPIGRIAMGVKGIKLNEDDEVVAGLPVHNINDEVALFTANGMGKKTKMEDFPIQNRGGKGTIAYKPGATTGEVVDAAMVSDEDNILIVGTNSIICISSTDIPSVGKTGTGNTLTKNNRIISVAKV